MKLTSKARSKIPAGQFAGPNRSFPIEDKNHAKAALSGATRAVNAGHISLEEAAKIRSRATAKLGK